MNFNLKKYLVFSTAAFGVLNVSETMSMQSSYYSDQYDNQYARDTNTNLLPKMSRNNYYNNNYYNNGNRNNRNSNNRNNNFDPSNGFGLESYGNDDLPLGNFFIDSNNMNFNNTRNLNYENYYSNDTVNISNTEQHNEPVILNQNALDDELANVCNSMYNEINADNNKKGALGSYYVNIALDPINSLKATALKLANAENELGTQNKYIRQIFGMVKIVKSLRDKKLGFNLGNINPMFNKFNNAPQYILVNIISTLKDCDEVLSEIVDIVNNYNVSDDIKILNILECLCNNTWLYRGKDLSNYFIGFVENSYDINSKELIAITANGKIHLKNGISKYVDDSSDAQHNEKNIQYLLDSIYDKCKKYFKVNWFQNRAFGLLINPNIINKEFIEKSIPTLSEFKTPYDILYWLKSPNMPVDDKLKNKNPVMNGGEHGEGSGNQQNNNNTPGTPNNEKFVEIKGLSDALKNLGCQNNKVFVEASPEKLKDATEIKLQDATVENLAEGLKKNGKVAIDMRGLTMGKRLNLSEKTGVEKMFKAWSGGVNGWLDNKNSVFINVVLEK